MAAGRPARAPDTIPALAILLLAGLALRLTIAYILFPSSGFASDVGSYVSWALTLAEHGPGGFYANVSFADYPPGYLYVLWPVGMLAEALAGASGSASDIAETLIKVPPMLADLAVAFVLYRLVRGWSSVPGPRAGSLALLAAALYLFNPVTIYDSALWGQTDAVGALVMLVGVAVLLRGHPEAATVLAVLAGLVKPQFGVVLAPLVAIVLLRRHLFAPGSGPRGRLRGFGGVIADWSERDQGPVRLVTSAVAGLVALLLLITPFSLDIPGFVELMAETAGGYKGLSVNAYNPWALVGSGGQPSLAQGGGWSNDTIGLIGPIPGVVIGAVLLLGGYVVAAARLAWRADRWSIVLAITFLSLAFFVLPTRVHERYVFPAFAFLPLLAVAAWHGRWALGALALGSFMNLHGVLTSEDPVYGTPNVATLPLGELFRSFPGVLVSALLHVAVFGYVAWQLRRDAVRHPDPLASAVMEGGDPEAHPRGPQTIDGGAPWPGARTTSTLASGTGWRDASPGPLAWLVSRLHVRPLRADRTALLERERFGRPDRLDLLVVVLLIIGALTLRGYRLSEPYNMHFDEVYHARTATEFLQHWRYDDPHAIYEYTHPHVAKYLIALGIIAFGNDRVTATSELGTPVADADIERRWSASDRPSERNGDRLYVATGTEVRAYDLADRDLVATIAAPATSVVVDDTSRQLVMAADDGRLWSVPTGELDALRQDPSRAPPVPSELQPVEPTGAEAVEMLAAVDGTVLVRAGPETLVAIDPVTGDTTGTATVAEPAAVVRAPSEDRVMVDPATVTDTTTLAANLADMLGDDEDRIADLLDGATAPVVIAGYLDEATATAINEGIDDGTLTGVSVQSGPVAAVGGAEGVTFLDAGTLAELTRTGTSAAVTGLALVEGLDDPTIYAAVDGDVRTVALRDEGPAMGTELPMPGAAREVFWDASTNLVHVLGETPDGSEQTAYVIEPHANAVFADARVGFDPAAVVMDIQPDRPAQDRQDLLAVSSTGTVASVDVGAHAFSWRIMGVIFGALMAAGIYLLARTLFQRRSVAVIAAVLVMIEGMAFANSRIAMNDTYVATFIVLAVALFTPLYLGIWRRPIAVAVVLPLVGLLLGLALGTKWVGAYAIGLVVLLVLLRSALGRVIALVGMIGLTGALGYLGLRSDPATPDPNLNVTFLVVMLALTALLAVAMVLRPVRATLDELRFAVVAPAALGGALVLAGIVLGRGGTEPVAGPLTPSLIMQAGAALLFLAALAYGGSWLLARWGVGPLAPERRREPGLAAPSPAPSGWLRPGAFAGIPWLYAMACLVVLPFLVYVATYIPWVALGNQLWDGFPAGHTGQTLLELTKSMYEYHNNLRAGHAASSPWWAWPFDLKPVWFYQDQFANDMTGVIYDAGNLVIFWLAIPAVAFAAWQAWRRRSLALTVVVLAVMALWLPWVRIDRATFQYHVFTSLPFALIALAYFLAELWHGASSRTFLLARAAGALAILGPPLLWLGRVPLCIAAGTEVANPDGVACGPLTRTVTLADNVVVSVVIGSVALAAIGWLLVRALRRPASEPPPIGPLLVVAMAAAAGVAAAQFVLPGEPAWTITAAVEELVLGALLLLLVPAYLAFRVRDARRWVLGVVGAAALFFVVWYPQLSGLPMPNTIAPAFLGLLPTWNYDFQFAVNLDPAPTADIDRVAILAITAATALLCLVAMLVARWWRSDRARPMEGTRTAGMAGGVARPR